MDVAKHYTDVLDRRRLILNDLIADATTFAMQMSSQNYLGDLDILLAGIEGVERAVFMQACREYQYALEAAAHGHYRHAFASLRLAFELFMATYYFSANQMKLHLWLAGHGDLIWSALNDPDMGVFSRNFLQAFNPALQQYRTQYITLANTLYRECSQYVHGNPNTHENAASQINYDADKVRTFHDKVDTMLLCVLFGYVSRYLVGIKTHIKIKIEPIVLEAFGTLPEIQASFAEVHDE